MLETKRFEKEDIEKVLRTERLSLRNLCPADAALFQKLHFVEECYAASIQSYVFTIYGKAD